MSARPRGFIQRWSPRAETRELLDQANQVVGEYLNLLPLTARQIFYRLVGAYGYEKTEQASERLGESGAIEARLDRDLYDRVVAEERQARRGVLLRLGLAL